jgi:hypothetical protein
MAHFDDAKHLVYHAKNALPKLEQEYQSALHEKTIKPTLLIDIKNIMENLRSALDFSAHGLFTKYGSSPKADPNIYFPYAGLGQSQAAFQASKRIETSIPGITIARPDIVVRLESYQHFAAPTNQWLPQFMELNNENKHEKLTPQTRTEAKQLRIESAGTALEVGPGAGISVGPGAFIQLGDALIPGGQDFSGERPATIHGSARQTVIVWVSFSFDSNGEPVVPFLKNAVAQVERIVAELSAL